MLINGLQIAEESFQIISEKGYKNIDDLLNDVDSKYKSLIKQRKALIICQNEIFQQNRSLEIVKFHIKIKKGLIIGF